MNPSVIKDTFIYFTNIGIVRFLNIVTIPIFTAYLTPSDFGFLALNAMVTSIGGIAAGWGLDSFANRLEIKYFDKPEMLAKSLFWVFGLNIALVFIACSVLSFLPIQIYKFIYQGNQLPHFYLYLIPIWTVFVQRVITLYQHYQINLQQAASYARLNLAIQLLNFGVLIPGFLVFNFSLTGFIIATFAVQLFFALLIAFLWIPKILRLDRNYSRYASLGLRYGLPLHFQGYISIIQEYLDRFLILKNLNISSLGLYSFAFSVAGNYLMLSQSAHYSLNPYLYKKLDQKEFSQDKKAFYRICLFYFLLIALIGFTVSLFAKEAIEILTNQKFHDSYKIIPLIIVGYLIQDTNGVYNATRIFIKNRTPFMAFGSYFAVFVKAICLVLLIPKLGLSGAVIAFAAYQACNFLLSAWYADKALPLASPVLPTFALMAAYGLIYVTIEYILPLDKGFMIYLIKSLVVIAASAITIILLKKTDGLFFARLIEPLKRLHSQIWT